MGKLLLWAGLCVGLCMSCVAAAEDGAAPTIESFVKRDLFGSIRISPTGEFLAVSVPLEDRTNLVLMRRSDLGRTGLVAVPEDHHVADFEWVNDGRVLFSVQQQFGDLEAPQGTGELFGVNADGKGQGPALVGMRSKSTGSRMVAASLIDTLPDDEDHVLVSVSSPNGVTLVDRMHVRTGRRVTVGRVPIRRAQFLSDPRGQVRFATGLEADNTTRTYFRPDRDAEWELINDEKQTGTAMHAVGFSADGATAYLQSEEPTGPDAIYAFDTTTRERKLLLRDDIADPSGFLHSPADGSLYGVVFASGVPKVEYVDPDNRFALQLKAMQAGLPDQAVLPVAYSKDGTLGVYIGFNDRTPGVFYLFDRSSNTAAFLVARNSWIKPDQMHPMRPVSLAARDGRRLHGFLTLPNGSAGKGLPLVVNPHGGPFEVADTWGFNREVQLLASRGYAVLQVNFRGSGGFGREFVRSGYQQWGRAMQDDITDATRWAVETGVADPGRICVYGGSYGAYAALMGAAREPDLYRCAIGNVGVYDLPLMYQSGDIPQSRLGKHYLEVALGRQDLAAVSPNRIADRIKVPVLLAAGREDARAPPIHTEKMDAALKSAGVPVETVIYEREGHGYYLEKNRVDFYTRLLAFLDRHIGVPAKPAD